MIVYNSQINSVIKTLQELGCNELAEMYGMHLIDKRRQKYWENYFNPKILKIDDVFEQLSICTYETKEEAESFGDAMLDTIKYFDTEIVVLKVT